MKSFEGTNGEVSKEIRKILKKNSVSFWETSKKISEENYKDIFAGLLHIF